MSFVFHKPYAVAQEQDLVVIPKHITRDPDKIYKACPSAVEALKKMCNAAESDRIQIVVISAHRTLDFQNAYFVDAEKRHGKGKGALWVAPGGYSEHHTGYVFDLADKNNPATDDEPSFEKTQTYAWLKHNAHRFGFVMSFPPGNWQGVSHEPWHWRYEGDETSAQIFRPSILNRSVLVMKSILKAFGMLSAFILMTLSIAHAEKITFTTSDRLTLEGDFLKPSKNKPTIVLLHGYLSNRPEWEPFAQYCHSRGLGVFYYDLRGHGKSQGISSDMKNMVNDLGTAVRFISSKYNIPRKNIGVGGASVGANIAFQYAASGKEVPFAVLLSPGLNYQGLTTAEYVSAYGTKPLLMAASSDDQVAFYAVNSLEKMLENKSNVLICREPADAGHGVQMLRRQYENSPSRLEETMVQWIEKNAKK